jgi:hypothetical protein
VSRGRPDWHRPKWSCVLSTMLLCLACGAADRPTAPSRDLPTALVPHFCSVWHYAQALHHAKAPRETVRETVAQVPTEVLLAHFGTSSDDRVLARMVARELLERKALAKPVVAPLPDDTKLALAHGLAQARSDACVPIYKELMAVHHGKRDGGWVPALGGLGFHYMRTAQHERALKVFVSADQYTDMPLVIADYRIEAARTCKYGLGQEGAAQKWYAEAASPEKGNGWIMGAVWLDQARGLVLRGKLAEAKEILAQKAQGYRAAEMQIGLDLLRGRIAYLEKDFETAKEILADLVQHAAVLDVARPELTTWTTQAKEGLRVLAAPPRQVFFMPKGARIALKATWDGGLTGSIELKTREKIKGLIVEAPPGVSARPLGWYGSGFLKRAMLRVEVSSPVTQREFEIRVRCPTTGEQLVIQANVVP